MSKRFSVQKYFWANERINLSSPIRVDAIDHDDAVTKVFGRRLDPTGALGTLAAKAWTIKGGQPDIQRFFSN